MRGDDSTHSRGRFLVLADDLTGAAEVATHAHRMGLPSVVYLEDIAVDNRDRVAVLDLDTRDLDGNAARSRVERMVSGCEWSGRSGRLTVLKKVDSLLRGNILAELSPLLRSENSRYQRVLLVPQNPGIGRAIEGGRYRVDGVALHETPLAMDPVHPRWTDSVRELLGSMDNLPVVCLRPGRPLPEHGIAVGDAATTADLETWAGCIDDQTLAAGGAEFLAAVFRRRVNPKSLAKSTLPADPGRPQLFLSGSAAPAAREAFQNAVARGIPAYSITARDWAFAGIDAPVISGMLKKVAGDLGAGRQVVLRVGDDRVDGVNVQTRIGRGLAMFLEQLIAEIPLRHLYAEGGATAAVLARHFGWNRLRVVCVHGVGTATLETERTSPKYLSMKPGSYAFPDSLWS